MRPSIRIVGQSFLNRGLRLGVAYCDELRVVIAEGVARRDSLPDEFLSDAVSDL